MSGAFPTTMQFMSPYISPRAPRIQAVPEDQRMSELLPGVLSLHPQKLPLLPTGGPTRSPTPGNSFSGRQKGSMTVGGRVSARLYPEGERGPLRKSTRNRHVFRWSRRSREKSSRAFFSVIDLVSPLKEKDHYSWPDTAKRGEEGPVRGRETGTYCGR